MFGWKKFDGKAVGVKVEGDSNVRPTTFVNRPYMQWFGWKTVAVFRVSAEIAKAGYRWGYIPTANGLAIGVPMLSVEVFHDKVFRVRVGREDCTFFAVDADGKEVGLVFVEKTTKKNGFFAETPLR